MDFHVCVPGMRGARLEARGARLRSFALARRSREGARRAVSPISLLVLFDSFSTVLSPNLVLFPRN